MIAILRKYGASLLLAIGACAAGNISDPVVTPPPAAEPALPPVPPQRVVLRTLRMPGMRASIGNHTVRTLEHYRKLLQINCTGGGAVLYESGNPVDFEREMVLLHACEVPSSPWTVEITEVQKSDAEIVVRVRKTRPEGAHLMMVEYHTPAVVVERSSLPVRFEVR